MFQALKGDKVLWGILGLLAIFSFLPVFSASSNLSICSWERDPLGLFDETFCDSHNWFCFAVFGS